MFYPPDNKDRKYRQIKAEEKKPLKALFVKLRLIFRKMLFISEKNISLYSPSTTIPIRTLSVDNCRALINPFSPHRIEFSLFFIIDKFISIAIYLFCNLTHYHLRVDKLTTYPPLRTKIS